MSSPLKNASSSKNKFNIKSHKIIRHKTQEKQCVIPNEPKIISSQIINRVRINSMKNISPSTIKQKYRKYTQIQSQIEPLANPFKLSPPKLYESKLKISAESWILYDMKNQKYKRGWKPNNISNFNGMLRIVILLCYCELAKINKNITKAKVKINPSFLKQSKFKLPKKQQKRLKWIALSKKTSKTLANGTIIELSDLIKSMVISGNQDLFQYSLIFVGYVASFLRKNCSIQNLETIICIEQQLEQQYYAQQFCNYCNQELFKTMNLQNTRTQIKEFSYELISTPNQISKIFLQGFDNHDFFRSSIKEQKIVCFIRYQVGFKFWQDRTLTIKSKRQQLNSDYFCFLVYKGKSNHQAICYNTSLQILMIIWDSKFAMAELDINVLQKWFSSVTKPINSIISSSSISPQRKKTKNNIFSISQLPSIF